MRLRVLGCSGSIGGQQNRTTSFLVDQDVLIDAGTGVGDLSLAELTLIDHIFITHSHLDHVDSIAFFLDSAEVRGLRREYSDNAALFHSLSQTLADLKAGIKENPRQHIRHMAVPDDPAQVLRFDRASETWAATSLSLLLFAIAALIFFAPKFVWIWLVVILILFLVIESILRGRFIETVAKVTIWLALVASLILFFHFWKWILVGALVIMGASLMYQRLRELA